MDSIEHRAKRQATAEFGGTETSSRGGAHVLLSISFFFFFFLLFSVSSRLPHLLHDHDLHLHLLLIDLPGFFWVDRKVMFLLCNLILAVVARDSGLLSGFGKERDHGEELSLQTGVHKFRFVASGCPTPTELSLEPAPPCPREEEEERKEVQEQQEEEDKGGGGGGREVLVQEEEEDNDWGAETDELNKKFDEFIAKMKRNMNLEWNRAGFPGSSGCHGLTGGSPFSVES